MRKTSFIVLFLITSICIYGQNRVIRVSSYNVRNENSSDNEKGNSWNNRYPVIVNMILFHDLDIIGTQECKKNQIKDLKKSLAKYNYNYIGRGRDRKRTGGEYSAIFYKTDKFKLIRSGNFWLSETPEVPGKGWDAALNRICTWGQFEDIASKFVFYTFNLHMDHTGANSRKYSSELVIEKIKEITNGEAVYLTGDFNTDQYSDDYKIITNSGILTDSYDSAPIVFGPNGTLNGFNIANKTNQRIDHIFISHQFIAKRYGILTDIYWTDGDGAATHPSDFPADTKVITGTPRLPSDHYPVVVEIEF